MRSQAEGPWPLHTAGLALAPVLMGEEGGVWIPQESPRGARGAGLLPDHQTESARLGTPAGVRLEGHSATGLAAGTECLSRDDFQGERHPQTELEPEAALRTQAVGLLLLTETLRPREETGFAGTHTARGHLFGPREPRCVQR